MFDRAGKFICLFMAPMACNSQSVEQSANLRTQTKFCTLMALCNIINMCSANMHILTVTWLALMRTDCQQEHAQRVPGHVSIKGAVHAIRPLACNIWHGGELLLADTMHYVSQIGWSTTSSQKTSCKGPIMGTENQTLVAPRMASAIACVDFSVCTSHTFWADVCCKQQAGIAARGLPTCILSDTACS